MAAKQITLQGNNAVVASMLARGNNTSVVNKVQFANNVCTVAAILPQVKALYQKTLKPVYIAGVISSTNNQANVKVALPLNTHVFNRLHFARVQAALNAAGVYALNPAATVPFGRAIKASKQLVAKHNLFTCPQMFNTHASTTAGKRAMQYLHRANARAARGCCCVVLVQWPYSLYSNGTQQELAIAIKHNPTAPIFRVV